MAGGKIIRITGGVDRTITENFTGYYENLTMTAGGENIFTAGNTILGTPKEPERKTGYFIKGWWSSDSEGKEKIKEALIGETVYFHLETRDIPNGKPVFMSLFDDDVKRSEEEIDSNKGSDRIELYPIGISERSNETESKYEFVKNNKIVKKIYLNDYFSKLISEEKDKCIELFFACSYNNQHIELPLSFKDYLKVREAAPLIVFVNGYWNISWIQKDLFGFSDGKSLQDYWEIEFRNRAIDYFSKDSKVYFINGADIALSSGQNRFNNGENFAKERLKNTESKFYKEIFRIKRRIKIISHSMGAAFSEGVLSTLKKQKIFVEKIIHFSPADVSDFSVTFPDRTYQIDISIDPVLIFKNVNDRDYIKNIRYAALIQNPDHDQYGHANTKTEGYVWNWFEDLESLELNFSHEDTEYKIIESDLGQHTTIPIKKVFYNSINLKYNTQFINIFKDGKVYSYYSDNIYYKIIH